MNLFSSFLIIFATFFFGVNGAALDYERVVGGSEIPISQAPYTVAVLADPDSTGVFRHICGGAIISQNRILTSAQCTNNFPLYFLRIRVGSTSHSVGGQVIQVFSYRQHPLYNSVTFTNDIAIVNLASSINLGPSSAVVNLAPQFATPAVGSNGTFTGWGRLSAGGILPANLNRVFLPTIDQNLCKSSYAGINEVTDGMICAGRIGVGGAGSCQGDTGGPLVVSGLLYGLASWGRGCGEPNFPSVFTKTSYFTDWVNSN